ncbi:hypothetical protein EV122DRAFT_173389, partial [Schizophyllum commune]
MSTADCPVCLESFAFPEEAVFFVVCGHCLCAGCWRQREWVRCPTCRLLAAEEDKPRPVFGRIFVHISPQAAAATCAHLAESRATLVVCVDQLRARVQVLGGEKRQLSSSLHTAQAALRAAEDRTKDRTVENLMLRDALCASANDTNTWTRRAEALESDVQAMKRDVDDRDNTVKLLTEQNHALAAKLAGY